MVALASSSKVLIVGAGPGGLTLAHCLRTQGIPYDIFERDSDFHGRKQGWAVALIECLADIEKMLPEHMGDLRTTSVNYVTDTPDSLGVVNGITGELIATVGGVKKGERGYVIRANRPDFRQFLLKDSGVQLGKQFERYEETQHGVTVYFKDESSAMGTILVAADGSHSRVRAQLLDNPSIVPSSYVPIFGEATLPRHLYEPIHNLGSSGVLLGAPGLRFMVGLRGFKADFSTGDYYWACCFQSDDPVADNAWTQAASKQSLYNRSIQLTQHLPPTLTDVIRYTSPEGMVTPPIRFVEYIPPNALPRGRVTLLGDAAHTMVPFRGAGANLAIQDACDLARLVTKGVEEGSELEWVLQRYEQIILPRGRKVVLQSRAAGEAMNVADVTKGRVSNGDVNLPNGKNPTSNQLPEVASSEA